MRYCEQLEGLNQRKLTEKFLKRYKKNEYTAFEPTKKQRILLCFDYVLEVFFGGAAGPGKTIALLMAALQYVHIPGYNAILIRDTYANLSKPDSLIPISHEWLAPTNAHWQGINRVWRFPSGATLSFGHLDTERAHFDYQSAQFQFVGIDEMVAIREHQAMYMFSRLRKIKGMECPIRFRGASNPPAREQVARGEWVKRRYVDPVTKPKDVLFLPAWMEDNPHLDKVQYEKSLAKLDVVTRRQLKRGDWEIRAAGDMFKREWFKIIEEVPQNIKRKVRYWDLAATRKTKENNPAFTAGVKMLMTADGLFIIEDVLRARGVPGEIERLIKQTAAVDGRKTRIYIEQEPGSAGKIVIDHYIKSLVGYSIRGDKVSGSKEDRAVPLSCQAEAGNVFLLKGRWNKDFLDEIEVFPSGAFKDQVDAASGGFNALTLGRGRARASVVDKDRTKEQKSIIDRIIEAENN